MTLSTDTDLHRLTERFLACSLPKSDWTHEAHFAVALSLLARTNVDAEADMPAFIRVYNTATGVANTDTEGYHETITLASLRGAKHHLDRAGAGHPLHLVLAGLMQGDLGRSDWLFAYWSRSRLFSVEARRTWVAPDLAPLPFR